MLFNLFWVGISLFFLLLRKRDGVCDDLPGEKWIQVEIMPELFVSNFGRLKNESNELVKTTLRKSYPSLSFKKKYFRLHRFVAEAFLPNPSNFRCVRHKNGDKLNNHINNLEWFSGHLTNKEKGKKL